MRLSEAAAETLEGALPNLLVIGAMKCGTTSVHEYLDRHPDIGMSDPKEVNFFSGENSGRSLDWYMGLFDPEKRIRGESSQNYSKGHHPLYGGAPARMAELVPDAKLIYLVRDPIERYRSHLVETFLGEPDHDVKWNWENDHYIKTGLYHYQLGFFLEHFPLEQILVVDLEDLKTRRLDTMNAIFRFLGLPAVTDAGLFEFVSNTSDETVVPWRMQRNLAYRAANRLAPRLTDRVLRRPIIANTLFAAGKKKRLSADERAALAARFKPDADELRKLLGRDFANWSV